jgi:hypothetical protein
VIEEHPSSEEGYRLYPLVGVDAAGSWATTLMTSIGTPTKSAATRRDLSRAQRRPAADLGGRAGLGPLPQVAA